MKQTASFVMVVGLACALGEWSPAAAQFQQGGGFTPGYSRPRVSPYLNLLRGGSTASGNYITLVRPELDAQRSINQLRGQTQLNQQAITGIQQGVGVGALVTGHPVGFQTQGAYFNSLGGGGGSPGFSIGGIGGSAGGQGYQSGGGGGSRIGNPASSRGGSRGGR